MFREGTLCADDKAFFLRVRDVVEAAVSDAAFPVGTQKLRRTQGIALAGDPVKTVEVLAQRYALNDTERSGVLRHLVTGGDLSGYGLVNAVTHFAQEVEDYDRASEFEALGGRLIDAAGRSPDRPTSPIDSDISASVDSSHSMIARMTFSNQGSSRMSTIAQTSVQTRRPQP